MKRIIVTNYRNAFFVQLQLDRFLDFGFELRFIQKSPVEHQVVNLTNLRNITKFPSACETVI